MSKWFVKTHWIIKRVFNNYIWSVPNKEKKIYLTFDDGPIPEVTPWVLDVLQDHDIKATFFCIGDNVKKHPEVLDRIIKEGHQIGNHTYNHLKGWNTTVKNYIDNVARATEVLPVPCTLFRPPYGKIKLKQSTILRQKGFKIVMWDVLSMDYDANIPKEVCLKNVIDHVEDGSIIVFHDSLKAYKNLKYTLPIAIEILKARGYVFSLL